MSTPYLDNLFIKENINKSIDLKIDSYHFFPKRFTTIDKELDFNHQSFTQKLNKLILPEEKTFFITLKNGIITGLNETLNKFISVVYHSDNFITLSFDNEYFFSSPANFNLVLLEIDFEGTLEIKSLGGTRAKTQNSFENSINFLHYQVHNSQKKSLFVFNFENINNNPINAINGRIREDQKLPVFFNYYNLTELHSSNYQDSNFIFNLSVPANIHFFQSEQENTLLKNNVMVNTLRNPYTNEETKININYFHCINKAQNRDDSFEVNHTCPNFHSEINYLVLNKGTAASQVNTYIAPDAPRSKSHQHLKHILLTDTSISYSKPNLMIENPDVEASHGNTMGGLNRDNLIYLQQRGISEEKAKIILSQSAIERASDTAFFSNLIKEYFIK